jgi:transcriptional regulator with XRE-family HTH domain
MIGPWDREHQPLERRPGEQHGSGEYRPGEYRPGEQHRPLLRTIVGDVLRRIRLDQGRTLADVAGEARVSMPYLSELERGRKEASSEILAAICAALDIDLSDLLAEARRELVQGPPAPVIRLDRTGYDQTGYDQAGYDQTAPGTAGTAGNSNPVCLLTTALAA